MRLSKLTSFATALVLIGPLQPSYAAKSSQVNIDSSLPKIYLDGCHLSQIETIPKYCAYGDLESKFKIILVGDSHAAQWFPALEQIAIRNNFKLISLTHSSCPFVNLNFYGQCKQWNSNVVKLINKWNPSVLIWSNLIAEKYPTDSTTNLTKEEWRVGFNNRLNQLKIQKSKILYIQDSPYPNFDVLGCLNANPDARSCNFTLKPNQIENAVFQILKSNKVSVVRTRNWFCESNICSLSKDNFNVYRDYSHISVLMSKNLSFKLGQALTFSTS